MLYLIPCVAAGLHHGSVTYLKRMKINDIAIGIAFALL